MPTALTLSDIRQAQARLQPHIYHTDLVPSPLFPEGVVFIKTENLQRTGSFKVRGAFNLMLQLDAGQKAHGVIAASAGNHAQGVALAAQELGVACTIVMPKTAPLSKIAATRSYGAHVVLHGMVYDEACEKAMELCEQSGVEFVHPFNDAKVAAGQGSIGLEILEDMPDVHTVLVPVGGGGLAGGVALAIKEQCPDVRVIGVEPEQAASMQASLSARRPVTLAQASTMADGIAVKTPGELTYELCTHYLDGIVTVSEDELARTILTLMERSKIIAEGAGAASMAALLFDKIQPVGKTVAILSGGNIDVTMVSRIIDQGLVQEGRKVNLHVLVSDRPGSLSQLLAIVADAGANVVSIQHHRARSDISLGNCLVELELETQDFQHIFTIAQQLKKKGFHTVER